MAAIRYCVFETALGPCGIAWHDTGAPGVTHPIAYFQLPEATAAETAMRLAQRSQGREARTPPRPVAAIIKRVQRHLNGKVEDFSDVPLALDDVPSFFRQVYEAARKIPAGQTRSYGEVAEAARRPGAARAVGQALGKNPVALIVPCHRVLAAGGRPGGFSAHGQLTTKARLLEAEGASLGPAVTLKSPADVRRAARRLQAMDPALAPHLEAPLDFRPKRAQSPYASLFKAVVHQQLSLKAAQTILGRVIVAAGGKNIPPPQCLLQLSEKTLRGAGLSQNKANALRDLAKKTISGEVPTAREIVTLGNGEIVRRLTSIYGVGKWTVEMLLIFQLGRADVWPVDDYAVRRSLGEVLGLTEIPTAKQAQIAGDRWRPYRSVVALHLWRRLNNS